MNTTTVLPSIDKSKNKTTTDKTKTGVQFEHPEYEDKIDRWNLITDVLEGEDAVKCKREKYLPRNNNDKSDEAQNRYDNYLKRAVFYNFTSRTVNTLVGMVFKKDPGLEVPSSLDYVEDDIDGAGVSIYQQSRKVYKNTLSKGRAGLLVDYPRTDGAVSRFDQEQGFGLSTTVMYKEDQIINWATRKIGRKHVLSLVVLKETETNVVDEQGFEREELTIYRVLKLGQVDEGPLTYIQEIWRGDGEHGSYELSETLIPLNSRGESWDFIPFQFVGAMNNDPSVDDEPIYDLATLNMAHYRNSADYEDSVFWAGHPQPVITGLTQQWVDDNLVGLVIGSGSVLPLPEGSQFDFKQVEPNTLVSEAMDKKVELAAAMGARLLEKGSAPKTATEAGHDSAAETSIASMVAGNVSQAYTQCLMWMQMFNGPTQAEVSYELNQDYINRDLDPQALSAILQGVMQGRIPESDLWAYLRQRAIIDEAKTDEEIKDELESQINTNQQTGIDFDEEDV